MNKFGFALCAGAAALSLSACLGSEEEGGAVIPAEYASLETLYNAIDEGELEQASASLMTGSATMTGVVVISDIGESEDMQAAGDLSLTADFDGGTASGSATSFELYSQADGSAIDDGALSGTLTVSGVVGNGGMSADLDGTLSDDDDHVIDMTMNGTFYDNSGDVAVQGDVTGTIDGEYYEGGFVATE